jgi:hypothetical protein
VVDEDSDQGDAGRQLDGAVSGTVRFMLRVEEGWCMVRVKAGRRSIV